MNFVVVVAIIKMYNRNDSYITIMTTMKTTKGDKIINKDLLVLVYQVI